MTTDRLTVPQLLKAALTIWEPSIGIAVQITDKEAVRVAATDRFLLLVATTASEVGAPLWIDTDDTLVLREKKDVEELLRFCTRHARDHTLAMDGTPDHGDYCTLEAATVDQKYAVKVPAVLGGYPKVTALLPTEDSDAGPQFCVDPKRMLQLSKVWTMLTRDKVPVDLTVRGRKPAVASDGDQRWTTLIMPVRKTV